MKGKGKQWAVQKHKCMILKMGVMILAIVLVLLLLNRSNEFSHQGSVVQRTLSTNIEEPTSNIFSLAETTDSASEPVYVSDDGSSEITQFNQEDVSHELQINEEEPPLGTDSAGECDLFTGEWIPNPEGPSYSNDSCNLIEAHQNCMTNGRPDLGQLYWRWRPRNCELPLFDAKRFLDMMRNKVWALIGDSISRNHVQSLLCTLSKVEEPVSIYHDANYRSRGWSFPSYNLSIYVLWSPFLVEATIYEDANGGFSDREIEVHLDGPDKKWTQVYNNFDYIIFATGKWFLRAAVYFENNQILGCHSCPNWNLTELGFDFGYRRALRNTLDLIANSGYKGVIFFRTCTPNHFEGGLWYQGGGCNRTIPFKEGEIEPTDLHNILRKVELEEFESAVTKASQNGVQLKLLDLMKLSLLRPDGHPGPYRSYYPFAKDKNAKVINDCLHWCLPGPIDSWNDIIMQMLANK